MANKWAIASGNWSDSSTWNDGVVPTADDDIFLNGKIVNMLNGDVLYAKKISNSHNNGEFSLGGYLYGANATANYIINADIFSASAYILRRFFGNYNDASYSLIINGNIECSRGAYLAISDDYAYYWLYINGNVKGSIFHNTYGNARESVFVNGNINDNGDILFYNENTSIDRLLVQVNGELKLSTNFLYNMKGNDFSISGKLKLVGSNATLNCTMINNTAYSFVVNGVLDISEFTGDNIYNDAKCSIKTQFGLKIYDEPKQTNYPQPANVLQGVEYGDSMVGTLTPFQGTLINQATVVQQATIVNLTEQQVNRVKNCATIQTVQQCFEDFKDE